jgi:hypothetical protein
MIPHPKIDYLSPITQSSWKKISPCGRNDWLAAKGKTGFEKSDSVYMFAVGTLLQLINE